MAAQRIEYNVDAFIIGSFQQLSIDGTLFQIDEAILRQLETVTTDTHKRDTVLNSVATTATNPSQQARLVHSECSTRMPLTYAAQFFLTLYQLPSCHPQFARVLTVGKVFLKISAWSRFLNPINTRAPIPTATLTHAMHKPATPACM